MLLSRAQLRRLGQQGSRQYEFLFEIIPFRRKPREVNGNPLLDREGCGVSAVLFRREHGNPLAAAHEYGSEGMGVRVEHWARRGRAVT